MLPNLIEVDLFDLHTEVLLFADGAEDTDLKRIAVALGCGLSTHDVSFPSTATVAEGCDKFAQESEGISEWIEPHSGQKVGISIMISPISLLSLWHRGMTKASQTGPKPIV